MAYVRKTRDLYIVMQYTGCEYGWEEVSTEDSRTDAKERLKEYRANQPEYATKLVKKRVPK